MSQVDTHSARTRFWLVGAAYLAITFVFAYPFSWHLGSRLLSLDSDSRLVQWIVAWDIHAFTHQPWHIFDSNAFAPLKNTLAFAENLIGSALLAAPISWITGSFPLAMNVVTVASIPLSGLGTYLLARRLRVSEAGAILAGLIYAFSPPRFLRMEQFQLTTIEWIPFCLAYVHAYLDTGRKRDLRIALAFFSLQAITAGHGATFLTVAIVIVLAWRFALGEPLRVLDRIRDVGVTGALLIAPTILVFLPYRSAELNQGLTRNLDGWGTSPSSFFASPSIVDAAILTHLPAWMREQPDAYLFPGWLPLLLVLAGLVAFVIGRTAIGSSTSVGVWSAIRAQRTNGALLYAVIGLICFWFTLGAPFGIWPVVYKWPVLDFIRVPTRFVLLELLALAVLCGVALDRLTAGSGTRGRRVAALALSGLLLVEFKPMALEGLPYGDPFPAIDRWLKSAPKPFTVAELPMPDPDNVDAANGRNARFMLHSAAHFQKTVHGFSGLLPKPHEALYAAMFHFPDEHSIQLLLDFGVTYVVIHEDFTTDAQRAATTQSLTPFAAWLTFVHEEADGRVYALHRP